MVKKKAVNKKKTTKSAVKKRAVTKPKKALKKTVKKVVKKAKPTARKPKVAKASKAVAKKKATKALTKKAKPTAKKPKAVKTSKTATKKKALAKKVKTTVKKVAKKAKPAAKKPKVVKTSKTVTKKKAVTTKTKTPAKKISKPTSASSNGSRAKAPLVRSSSKKVYRKPLFPIKAKSNPTTPESVSDNSSTTTKAKLDKKFLAKQKQRLIELRDHILDQMQGVAQDSLRSKSDDGSTSAFGMHQADAGSDAYEKDFALSLLSQEQDALYEVEEAITRIETNKYGTCEMSGEVIPLPRLEAMPFARFTLSCQKIIEQQNRGRNRWDTAPQFMESTENFYEEDDDREEEAQKNLKG